ncbi:MAG TPA: DUF192 domain-containing protein [Candidatus Saccharimonadales bacterium]|nr:DUF192 domain-containing protein [Candidatus Saccharimonadales bacterium]
MLKKDGFFQYAQLAAIPVVIALVVIAVIFGAGGNNRNTASPCGNYRDDKAINVNGHELKTEVASTPTERAKGLAGRPCIESNQAMLFVFDHAGRYGFWMKDMQFSIDMVWIGSGHKVVAYQANISPSTYPKRFSSAKPSQYVLELRANRSKELGLAIGDTINF